LYGIYGAAIASVAASFIYNMVKFVFIYQKFKFQPYTKKSLYIFTANAENTVFVKKL
jgi:Na+-driven multidrug efflux pump